MEMAMGLEINKREAQEKGGDDDPEFEAEMCRLAVDV
jgi:hypothetical protein